MEGENTYCWSLNLTFVSIRLVLGIIISIRYGQIICVYYNYFGLCSQHHIIDIKSFALLALFLNDRSWLHDFPFDAGKISSNLSTFYMFSTKLEASTFLLLMLSWSIGDKERKSKSCCSPQVSSGKGWRETEEGTRRKGASIIWLVHFHCRDLKHFQFLLLGSFIYIAGKRSRVKGERSSGHCKSWTCCSNCTRKGSADWEDGWSKSKCM